MLLLPVACAMWCSCPAAHAAAIELARDGKSAYVIVIGDQAGQTARYAARDLQHHLKLVTGAELPIVTPATLAGGDAPKILIGRNPITREILGKEYDYAGLGDDGIVVRTVGDDIILTGGRARGTMYAVQTFLEDVAGVRWWTSSEATIPRRPTLTVEIPLDIRYVPKFRYREVFNADVMYKPRAEFATRLRLNGQHQNISREMGGHYSLLGWCHTSFALIPPNEHFAKHPEWFAMLDGKRQTGSQLCLTNRKMQKALIARALDWVRKNPDAGMISVSQNDTHGPCQCPDCAAVVAEEGSESGPWIRLCNAVAAEINKEFPEFLVETLAYQYTRKPPKKTKPSKNVLVRLCSIEANFAKPLSSDANKEFGDDLRGWKAIAPNLFIWNYVTNFANYLIPHPNMTSLAADLRFFADHNVIGVFEQGDYSNDRAGDFLPLRTWLLAKLLWDPSQDQEKLTQEFLTGYYGPAAPHLAKYLHVVNAPAENEQFRIGCYNGSTTFLSDAAIEQALKHFDDAARAVAGDKELERRVLREKLAIDHVRLLRFDFDGAVKRHANPEAARGEYTALVNAWAKSAKAFGVANFSEQQGLDAYVPVLAGRALRFIPPTIPPAGATLAPGQFEIQEDQFYLYRAPQLSTLVDDEKASNGRAARMPAGHSEWAVQFHVPDNDKIAGKGPWTCYLLIRVDADGAKRGGAFSFGLHDPTSGRFLARDNVGLEQVPDDGSYRAYGLTIDELKPGMYFWVAPPASAAKVRGVYVDRMFIQKQQP
jgi:hypothetical protein